MSWIESVSWVLIGFAVCWLVRDQIDDHQAAKARAERWLQEDKERALERERLNTEVLARREWIELGDQMKLRRQQKQAPKDERF